MSAKSVPVSKSSPCKNSINSIMVNCPVKKYLTFDVRAQ